ncbi:MAG TPA: pyridoxal phosphate-dependent aminotransferase [Candidatus Methanoculleus thermohydrogenotrophicum]|jgi:aspartate aminotransferase|nr:pyridoxal phosphate-dependent aminotransferase [Candidatus Methanoculleus thermohydrogenotrophicum]NLM81469.1 pyridoxal phosphate-dependent aminotransferase [Candidatus Methanoculleus thermohydrogenotrophicum]HOB18182.1 pyridoxal phosphate-dependent aminotransferase [Candidatus Methanoculleus thermohydrogenotrophicum]HPZ38306.1 pyridoxal phosphate-dependent aminotransferase [Candidatus Methanoculleus thermohydrogenotrophicum]HQC91581.1 pyridoxal phosphate-dependent aminotransferase [Candidat
MNKHRYASRVRSVEMSGIRKLFDAGGADAINLGIGQPDFDTPEHIKEAAIAAIRAGKTGYTPNAGIPELREAICTKFERENDLAFQPEQIIVTAGGSEALHLVMEALVDPGDRVLVTDPGFVSYAALATFAGGRPEGVPLDPTLHIDVEQAKEQMDGARLFVLNSPTNPTGVVESEESIRALVEYANDRGVTIVSDEVYEHFVYEKKHVSAGRFGEDVITVNAVSKTYAMTGWRIGYIAAPEDYIPECLKVHQYIQACATSISQYAALAAYTGDQGPVARMRDEYRARRDLLYDGLSGIRFNFPRPEGAFYMFVPMGRNIIEKAIEAGVIIVPGEAFGSRAPDYARISYATSRENLSRAVERLAALVE